MKGSAMFMSLIRDGAALGDCVAQVSWGALAEMGDAHPAGQVGTETTLVFTLSHTAKTGAGVLISHPCDIPKGAAFLRIDEVCFPVGAIAHRHTHTGAGIRHLVRGGLRIEADGHSQTMQVGDSWFEAAGSPVRAVAMQSEGVSSFLRAMVIPADYEGKSTFALVNPQDANLPRLQLTHRHIDLPLQLDAG